MLKYFLFLFSLAVLSSVHAQNSDTADMFVNKDFLILLSTKNYSAALVTAKKASKSQQIELRLKGLSENKQTGLSLSKEYCETEGWEFPAYYARGRWDDGVYISIEYSDAYSGFASGYYIVVAASGHRNDKEMKDIYKKVRTTYKTAYFKTSEVYVGCMH